MGGLADLSPSDIGWTLQGRSVSASADEDDDAWAVDTSPFRAPVAVADLDLEMQYLTAMLTAPGWRSEGWKTVLASMAQLDTAAQSGPGQVFDHNVVALLHPGDERWVYNTSAMRATWTPEEARAFIEPIMRQSQIEVIVVGDVTPEQTIAAVAKTFGALTAAQGAARAARRAGGDLPRADGHAGRPPLQGAGRPGGRRYQLADHRSVRGLGRYRAQRDPR